MSDTPETVTRGFIAQQNARIINELADLRANMAVLRTVTQRIDATVSGLIDEVRAARKTAQ